MAVSGTGTTSTQAEAIPKNENSFITAMAGKVVRIGLKPDEIIETTSNQMNPLIMKPKYVLQSIREVKPKTDESATGEPVVDEDSRGLLDGEGERLARKAESGFSSADADIKEIRKVTEVRLSLNGPDSCNATLSIEDLDKGKYYQGTGLGKNIRRLFTIRAYFA